MALVEQYRPPGRSNRSGRSNADNDVFEGLPVKQWGQSISRVSLVPPAPETVEVVDDKWGEPPMPRDFHLLQPWTQQLLRLARSGKYGSKRKSDPDSADEDKGDDEVTEDARPNTVEDRGYVAKKWKPVPEALLEPEHRHFEYLAKRRKGLPSMYGPEVQTGPIPMRKTRVQRTGADGEVVVYEVLVPEGQAVEGEIAEGTELADLKPVVAAPGTVIEGVGIANDEGVVVAEHLKPAAAPRRNRPPPKKKGGPGRGKKRVTFTNPDGSTYTTIVPNATKIVPQPGQTVKHVAKGEEATADISAEQAAARAAALAENGGEEGGEGGNEAEGEGEAEGEEGEGSDDEGEDGDDDDDDREEGELSDDDAPTGSATPAAPQPVSTQNGAPAEVSTAAKVEDEALPDVDVAEATPADAVVEGEVAAEAAPATEDADASLTEAAEVDEPVTAEKDNFAPGPAGDPAEDAQDNKEPGDEQATADTAAAAAPAEGEDDLLGNLEKHLGS